MSQSLHANYAHIIFSTNGREPTITKDIAPQMYSYMSGIVRKLRAVPIRINGMPDHVHLLVKTLPAYFQHATDFTFQTPG